MRLVSGHDPNQGHYRFSAADWVTGDEGRVSASNITYDTQQNIIHVKASGQNNIALMLDYSHVEYTIDKAQTYFLVRGTNLRTGSGDSYLWWLNGTNKGSQVAPTIQKTITIDGQRQQVIAWDMTRSDLYTNFTGDRPDICQGQTIFGLTSTTGQSDILDINFVEDVNQYLETTSIHDERSTFRSAEGHLQGKNVQRSTFNLQGQKVPHPTKPGLYLTNGKVIAVTRY